MKTYREIKDIPFGGILVFGSNTQGRHGLGSAKLALNEFDAVYGQARGLQGRSYAIVTKDLTKKIHPSISEKEITDQIKELYEYARQNPSKEFYVAYRGIGSNLNSYSPTEMAGMFYDILTPDNIIFEEEFSKLVNQFLCM